MTKHKLLSFVLLIVALSARSATVTGDNEIVYTIISEADKTVSVSLENKSIFSGNETELTIPAEVNGYRVVSMVNQAFQNCPIKGMTIEAPLTVIPDNSFQGCEKLEYIILPSTITSIGTYAFNGCTSLAMPDLPEGLETIGMGAFTNCKNLGRVTFPSTLNKIVSSPWGPTFGYCNITELIWPDNCQDISIDSYAFAYVTGLKKVSISPGQTELGGYQFFQCQDLEEVDLSKVGNGFVVGDYCFKECHKLTAVTFPTRIKKIGLQAFYSCNNLDVRSLPAMTTLGSEAFARSGITEMGLGFWPSEPIVELGTSIFSVCLNLSSVVVPDWMAEIPAGLCDWTPELESLTIGEGVTSIGVGAFTRCKFTNVSLPSTLVSIGNNAFQYSALTAIEFPSSLKSVGAYAFANTALQAIDITGGVTYGNNAFESAKIVNVTWPEHPVAIGANLLKGNLIANLVAPAWMTEIPTGLLMENDWLTSVTFADATTRIGDDAFNGCRRLTLEPEGLPETIIEYGERAFRRGGSLLANGMFLCSVELGDDIEIADNAFEEAKIRSLGFKGCDFILGGNVFRNVTTITEIVFPDCMTTIPAGFCNGWTSLTSVTFPASMTEIGSEAFRNCPNLALEINFNKDPFSSLTKVGDYAFSGAGVSGVVLPDSPMELGENLFNNCRAIASVEIPAWMDNIPVGFFQACSGLKNVTWEEPSDRSSLAIGTYAFYQSGVENFNFPDVPTTLGYYSFASTPLRAIDFPESEMTLNVGSFMDCTELTELNIPEYVSEIPQLCFSGCNKLTTVTLDENMKSMGQAAFSNCTSLESAYVRGAVTNIPEQAFSGCSSLKKLEWGCDVADVGISAFYGCQTLEAFPDIITAETIVRDHAFYGCSSLKTITLPSSLWFTGTPAYPDGYTMFDCAQLQSVHFMANGEVRLFANDFINAPLKGVSYLHGKVTDMDRIVEYTGDDRAEKGILMVERDQKWRLMEKGYGRLFDIREVHAPEITVYSDLTSQFSVDENVNHYTGFVRWEITLSDLNPAGPTNYTVYRRGNTESERRKVATLRFDNIRVVDGISELNLQTSSPALAVDITVVRPDGTESEKKSERRDIYFQQTETDFILTYINQHSKLYFEPSTSHRLGLNEMMGPNSWLLFIDEFDSPDLNSDNVPDSYFYTVELVSYDYTEPVNNDGFIPGEDGLVWHESDIRSIGTAASEPSEVYTAIAVPSLHGAGVYTLEEIAGDTRGELPVSAACDRSSASVDYQLNRDRVLMKLIDNGVSYIINSVDAVDVTSGREIIGSVDINGIRDRGSIQVGSVSDNTRLQTVTRTLRGSFGSRVVTIPGVPDLDLTAGPITDAAVGHDHGTALKTVAIDIYPYVTSIGYDDNSDINSENHRVGVWRSPATITGVNALTDASEVPVWHVNGVVEQDWMSGCDICPTLLSYDGDSRKFNDIFPADDVAGPSYRTRLYVQLPDDPSRWMIAEKQVNFDSTTELETIDADNSDIEIYTLSGMRAGDNPAPGIYIVRSAAGTRKVIIR